MFLTRRIPRLIRILLLPMCVAGCNAPAPPAALAVQAEPVSGALVLWVRQLPGGDFCAPVLTALAAGRHIAPRASGAAPAPLAPTLPADEVILRTDDGRVLSLVHRPRGAVRAKMRVNVRQGRGAVSIDD